MAGVGGGRVNVVGILILPRRHPRPARAADTVPRVRHRPSTASSRRFPTSGCRDSSCPSRSGSTPLARAALATARFNTSPLTRPLGGHRSCGIDRVRPGGLPSCSRSPDESPRGPVAVRFPESASTASGLAGPTATCLAHGKFVQAPKEHGWEPPTSGSRTVALGRDRFDRDTGRYPPASATTSPPRTASSSRKDLTTASPAHLEKSAPGASRRPYAAFTPKPYRSTRPCARRARTSSLPATSRAGPRAIS